MRKDYGQKKLPNAFDKKCETESVLNAYRRSIGANEEGSEELDEYEVHHHAVKSKSGGYEFSTRAIRRKTKRKVRFLNPNILDSYIFDDVLLYYVNLAKEKYNTVEFNTLGDLKSYLYFNDKNRLKGLLKIQYNLLFSKMNESIQHFISNSAIFIHQKTDGCGYEPIESMMIDMTFRNQFNEKFFEMITIDSYVKYSKEICKRIGFEELSKPMETSLNNLIEFKSLYVSELFGSNGIDVITDKKYIKIASRANSMNYMFRNPTLARMPLQVKDNFYHAYNAEEKYRASGSYAYGKCNKPGNGIIENSNQVPNEFTNSDRLYGSDYEGFLDLSSGFPMFSVFKEKIDQIIVSSDELDIQLRFDKLLYSSEQCKRLYKKSLITVLFSKGFEQVFHDIDMNCAMDDSAIGKYVDKILANYSNDGYNWLLPTLNLYSMNYLIDKFKAAYDNLDENAFKSIYPSGYYFDSHFSHIECELSLVDVMKRGIEIRLDVNTISIIDKYLDEIDLAKDRIYSSITEAICNTIKEINNKKREVH